VFFLETHDNLMQNRSDLTIRLRVAVVAAMRPRQFQVSAQLHEAFLFRITQRGLLLVLDRRELVFKVAHRMSLSFRYRSSSHATRRLSGSTASYWRLT
jgi:hypothetical protein